MNTIAVPTNGINNLSLEASPKTESSSNGTNGSVKLSVSPSSSPFKNFMQSTDSQGDEL